MLDRGSPFRALVSLLLVVAIPFCCCSFKSWLGGQAGCHGVGISDASGESLPACHRCDTTAKTPNSDGADTQPRAPGEPTREPEGSCACGKHYTSQSGVEKPGAEVSPPILVAVLPETVPQLARAAFATRGLRFGHVPPRPQTALLRLHCALIV